MREPPPRAPSSAARTGYRASSPAYKCPGRSSPVTDCTVLRIRTLLYRSSNKVQYPFPWPDRATQARPRVHRPCRSVSRSDPRNQLPLPASCQPSKRSHQPKPQTHACVRHCRSHAHARWAAHQALPHPGQARACARFSYAPFLPKPKPKLKIAPTNTAIFRSCPSRAAAREARGLPPRCTPRTLRVGTRARKHPRSITARCWADGHHPTPLLFPSSAFISNFAISP